MTGMARVRVGVRAAVAVVVVRHRAMGGVVVALVTCMVPVARVTGVLIVHGVIFAHTVALVFRSVSHAREHIPPWGTCPVMIQ
ncbi:hypothetical protein Afil01_58380 [Actinorhabdospora filicis]|uniref:Uncharacterized protein n=1 Tax=Actinorhabdospora filicis TaxID=1785913 RepID=A0A9W6SRI7_9ACTN|nr:hypothetical protein Afil01_58380 [Actinorhabdospora filicis]